MTHNPSLENPAADRLRSKIKAAIKGMQGFEDKNCG